MFFSFSIIISAGILIMAFDGYEKATKNDSSRFETLVEEEEMVKITVQNEEIKKPEPAAKKKDRKKEQIIEAIKIFKNSEPTKNQRIIDSPADELIIDEPLTPTPEKDSVIACNFPSVMAEFPGGILALRRWIDQHVVYPEEARKNKIEGMVFLCFEVTKTGEIGKVKLYEAIDSLLDAEAIRVIKNLPKFKPGKRDGVNVSVWYSGSVTFRLD